MAVTTYILTSSDFTDRADISPNIKTNLLKQHLGVTQEKYAVKILCLEFYQEVLDVVAGTTVNADITALLPFIKDYLIYKTYARYLLYANQRSSAAGVRTVAEPVSTAASDKILSEMIASAKSDANFYQDQLVNYLECNEDLFPTWKDSICDCSSNRRTKGLNKLSRVGSSKKITPIKWT